MVEKRLDRDAVRRLLPERDAWAHKGNFGKLLFLCGSRGYTGAAALAAMGALRSGAGLVYAAVPACIYPILAVKLTEPVVLPLPSEDDTLSVDAAPCVSGLMQGKDVVLIGPGLGCSEGSFAVLQTVLRGFSGPVVVDADGINLLAAHKDLLRERTCTTILTPHDGEFARLGGSPDGGRAASAMALANDLGCIVLRKGHETVITDGTTCYINCTGNPGMAVGGSGDVLSGIIASLLGQGLAPLEAAAVGAWLHGAAGDLCRDTLGEYGMLPSDMVDALPRLMK